MSSAILWTETLLSRLSKRKRVLLRSSDQAKFKNLIIDDLDLGAEFDKKYDPNHALPEFIKRNYTDSIKVFTSKDLHYSGEQKANLKDKYMSTIASQELFALTPILEERMREENHYSLNPRRRSKAGISQSNVVSNIT